MSCSINSSRVFICLRDKSNGNVAKCGKVDVLSDNTLKVQRPKLNSKVFGPFNRILDKDVNHQRMFYEVAKVHVDEGFNGIKSFVISYGFSSSGKTDALFGSDIKELGGIVRETLDYIDKKKLQDIGNNVDFYLSVFEICGDKIFDLLVDDRKEISIISDDDNKLIVKDPAVISILDTKIASCTIRNALNRRSLTSNADFDVVGRSHVIVKLKIVTKNKRGIINYGEVVFVDLSSTNFNIDPHDKQLNSEIKSARVGYISLNLLLGKILKNPQPSQSFRESTLTRILRPALSGAYASSMIFTVTTDYVPPDANQSLEIADKYRKLKCCPQKESLISFKVRKNIRNIRIPQCFVEEVKMIELTTINYKSTGNIQSLHQEIEESKKQLDVQTDVLGKLEFDFRESSKICNEKNFQYDFCLKEKREITNRLTNVNQENFELNSKVDKLENEIKNLLDKRDTLKVICNEYLDKLDKNNGRGISLLNKDSFFNKSHVEMNNSLAGNIKDLETNYLQIKGVSNDLIDKHKIFVNELAEEYSRNHNDFKQIEDLLRNNIIQLDNYLNTFEQSTKERLSIEVKNEFYEKVNRKFNGLLLIIEETKNKCTVSGDECFTCIDEINKDEEKKITKFFRDYEECLRQEICQTEEIISTNNERKSQIELVKNDIHDISKILKEVDTIQIPSIDLSKLNLPSKEECKIDEDFDPHHLPKFIKTEKSDLINEVSSIVEKVVGNDYYNLLQKEENKENV